ncbi:MAG: tyrosine-type recombinase/integrase [Dehalococcoidia bacterium]
MLNPEIDKFLREVLERRHSTELDNLIEYEAFCGRAEGKSQKTIALTALALTKLKNFLEENHLPTEARMIGAEEMRHFILHLQGSKRFDNHPYAKSQERGLSRLSINCYLRAVRAAFNRWVDGGLLETTPFSKVTIPKAPKKVIPTFSEQQLDAFFHAIDTSTPKGFRDYTLFLLYLDTMCRLSEATNASVEDLNMQERTLRVVGKGNRQRLVPFGVTVQKTVWKYLNFYRPQPAVPNHDYVFLTRDGRQLTKNRVEELMKKYGQRAGIKGVRCSPHTLRHTACVMWIRNGGDIFSLQRITGHSSLEVLRGYINLAQSDISAAHRRNSPIDNLGLRISTARRPRK